MAEPAAKRIELEHPGHGPEGVKITISLTSDLLKLIEDYHFGMRLKSTSAAVRQLVEIGLQTEAWRSQKKPRA